MKTTSDKASAIFFGARRQAEQATDNDDDTLRDALNNLSIIIAGLTSTIQTTRESAKRQVRGLLAVGGYTMPPAAPQQPEPLRLVEPQRTGSHLLCEGFDIRSGYEFASCLENGPLDAPETLPAGSTMRREPHDGLNAYARSTITSR